LEQLISHFHEFRKEFLAQCEIFRVEIQALRESNLRHDNGIRGIEVDINEMQKELHKMHQTIQRAVPRHRSKSLVQHLTNPLVILGAVIFFLILLISDLKVEKENGLLKGVIKAIPGVKE
jgi:phosphoglycerate-specific signal transduction histidine kinase